MEFNESCACCQTNQAIFMTKKQNQSLAARKYYQRNREKIIVDILKKYYRRKQSEKNIYLYKTKDGGRFGQNG